MTVSMLLLLTTTIRDRDPTSALATVSRRRRRRRTDRELKASRRARTSIHPSAQQYSQRRGTTTRLGTARHHGAYLTSTVESCSRWIARKEGILARARVTGVSGRAGLRRCLRQPMPTRRAIAPCSLVVLECLFPHSDREQAGITKPSCEGDHLGWKDFRYSDRADPNSHAPQLALIFARAKAFF